MQIFISWSGKRSKAFALHLHKWIKNVLPNAEPWISERDIAAGQPWNRAIAERLRDTHVGIICLTPENLDAPWLLFEAGAIAKAVDSARVIPVLFNVSEAEPKSPLAQFQSVEANRAGFFALISSINSALGDRSLPLESLTIVFDSLWPKFWDTLDILFSDQPATPVSTRRSDREILEELLDSVRILQRETGASGTRFNEFSDMETSSWEEYFVRGVSHADERRDDSNIQALKAYSQAIALMPKTLPQNFRSRLYAYRGAMFKRLGRLQEAEHDLMLARQWATDTYEIEDAAYNMACIMSLTGRLSEALELVEFLVDRNDKWRPFLETHSHYFQPLMNDPEFRRLVTVK